ncbi:uncharacterized protein RSE6_14419 [Rhynchosporium secalis]|uniref:Uncharacterized protein n=1 Tax=Rhynchosporium secalis TaxID=38038 RepID=A0A1E1MV86_RHYSE|nr:uncharacterized protein RSE6_14419 [Rhynchosporium secalis]
MKSISLGLLGLAIISCAGAFPTSGPGTETVSSSTLSENSLPEADGLSPAPIFQLEDSPSLNITEKKGGGGGHGGGGHGGGHGSGGGKGGGVVVIPGGGAGHGHQSLAGKLLVKESLSLAVIAASLVLGSFL